MRSELRHRLLAVGLGAAALVAGCSDTPQTTPGPTPTPGAGGGTSEAGQTPTPAATATPPPGEQATATPTTAEAGSPLQRRDVPPGGVDAQLAFFTPSAGCGVTDSPGPPEPGPDAPAVAEVAHRFCIAFSGFDPAQESFELVLIGPDGGEVIRTQAFTSSGSGFLAFDPSPAHQKGTYTYTASQPAPAGATEPTVVTGTFELIPATTPGSVTMSPPGPAGSAFQIGLSGFPPGTPVEVFLYQALPDLSAWSYLTALPPVGVDAVGEAIFSVQTAPGDPPGRYGIATRPETSDEWCTSAIICAQFEVTP